MQHCYSITLDLADPSLPRQLVSALVAGQPPAVGEQVCRGGVSGTVVAVNDQAGLPPDVRVRWHMRT